MHFKYLIIFVSIFGASQLYAADILDDLCIADEQNPPCNGAPGKCTTNSDGSIGGFVAKTAHVQSTSIFGFRRRNVPYIDIFSQVCDSARVYGKARIYDSAKITGLAEVYGNAQVYGNGHVGGLAKVFDNAQVFGFAQADHSAWVYGNVQVYGDARALGHARLFYGNFSSGTITLDQNLPPEYFQIEGIPNPIDRSHALNPMENANPEGVIN